MKKHQEIKRLIIYTIVIVLFSFAVTTFFNPYETHRSIPGIPDPVQTETEGSENFTLDGYNIDIYYLYEYDIEGLVVSTNRHYWFGIDNELSPVDAAIAWGPAAELNNKVDFHWGQTGRYYHFRVSGDDMNIIGDLSEISCSSSNNHLVPSDSKTRSQVKKIRTGDHIKIKGYLVNIDGLDEDGKSFYWDSSTTRDDTGDGACELIYVTDVQWL